MPALCKHSDGDQLFALCIQSVGWALFYDHSVIQGVVAMHAREQLADVIAGQTGRRQRKQFVRSLKETAARAVVTASVTFAVGWVLKQMFENSVADAAKQGAAAGSKQSGAKRHTAN
jgi:uncharacterized protein (DUF697 family)